MNLCTGRFGGTIPTTSLPLSRYLITCSQLIYLCTRHACITILLISMPHACFVLPRCRLSTWRSGVTILEACHSSHLISSQPLKIFLRFCAGGSGMRIALKSPIHSSSFIAGRLGTTVFLPIRKHRRIPLQLRQSHRHLLRCRQQTYCVVVLL